MFYYFDPTMLIVLPGLILALLAQWRVDGCYKRYAQVRARSGLTGSELAERLLRAAGIENVRVEYISGHLTDHYDPKELVLRLSDGVYNSDSIAALGIAAHETGHVLQHQAGYQALMLRTAIVPAVNIGSSLSWPMFLIGLIFSWEPLIWAGILLFSLAVLFSLVTLPVEFNASNRAMALLETGGYLQADELPGAKSVLSAAAMTYVASALMAILQLLRLLAIAGVGKRRD